MIDKRDFSPGLFSRPLAGLCGNLVLFVWIQYFFFFFVTWLLVFLLKAFVGNRRRQADSLYAYLCFALATLTKDPSESCLPGLAILSLIVGYGPLARESKRCGLSPVQPVVLATILPLAALAPSSRRRPVVKGFYLDSQC